MIPEFSPVVGRVHHDVYHVYTVDVHSVAAVDRLREMIRGELAAEHRLASRLAAEISRPHVLFFAALLHDIGKDIGGRDHPDRGHDMTRPILERLGFADQDIREVQNLVAKHLRMYHVATRRDIDDPATIEAFCNEVHGREGLRELYLLTLCDVGTTSPTALTSWKARVLEELYVSAEQALVSGGVKRDEARLEHVREAVRAMCPKRGEREFLDHYLQADARSLPLRERAGRHRAALALRAAGTDASGQRHRADDGRPVRGARVHRRRSPWPARA